MKKFPFYLQHDFMDCGPTCLRMVAKYYGKAFPIDYLRQISDITREGVSFLSISEAAEKIGFRTLAVKIPYENLSDINLPCIVHWNKSHFVIIHKIIDNKIYVADPACGLLTYTEAEFKRSWISTGDSAGFALVMEPTDAFYDNDFDFDTKSKKRGFAFLASYLQPYRRYIIQLMLGLVIGSLLQLIFPFLTQSIVDKGINNRDIGFVYTILIAQLMLFFSRTTVEFIRSWILLHISSRINISIISDFLIKLMKLPISFFDSKMIGDILQRINDHDRIQTFLTGSSLNILFSVFNLLIFSIVLLIYNKAVLFIFLAGSIIYVLWILMFIKKRREYDYKRFSALSNNQSGLIQLIYGMQDIKLNGAEQIKRWEWERIQIKLFKINIGSLTLSQYQQAGALFINELKNIIITFYSAKLVIDGQLTLGMMLSVTYIIGQLNNPIDQLISFIQTGQDALISLERMTEVYDKDDEEKLNDSIHEIPKGEDLVLKNVHFKYGGAHSNYVLNNINLTIPNGKVTAIVGASGSGKTTLLKLLLKFYEQEKGELYLGSTDFKNISPKAWRNKCGVVMQEGYIFSDNIANNIMMSHDAIDKKRLKDAIHTANIEDYISSLPLGMNTKIGQDGIGLSQGQKQRLLIARAVYKNPDWIFFDEATNALDANNEQVIMRNLEEFFKDRTVIVVAHRLSTVKNADQILVLNNGEIVEIGNHASLTEKKGAYYQLVKNQLELGN